MELPLDCRYEILRKVKAGTGLVGHLPAGRDEYINRLLQDRRPNPGFENPGPAPVDVVSAVPFAALPAFAAQADAASFAANTLETATFGRGRLAFLRASVPIHQMLTPGPTGRVQDCRLDYDYYLALAGKLIRWGAGRTPAVTVASPPEPRATRARAELAATPLTFLMIGMNDCSTTRNLPLAKFRENLAELCRRLSALPSLVVLQTTCPILPGTAPDREPHFPAYMDAIRAAAAEFKLPLIDHTRHWEELNKKAPGVHYYWMSNAFHPNTVGHRLFAELIYKELGIWDPASHSCRLFRPGPPG